MAHQSPAPARDLDAALFRDPPAPYRSAPFWSWNDDLADDELRRQIRALDEGGQGGFFMHARVGLRTPYLSDEWFARVRACVDEAARLGLGAWLYDEDRWPSGFAGGLVPAQDAAFRSQALLCLTTTTPVAVREALARVTGRLDGGRLVDVAPWSPEDGFPASGRVLVQCHPWTAPMGQGWFGGATYLDTLNPAAVAAFLRSTYDRYAAEIGGAFGNVVPGVFTDEPSVWYRGSLPAVHGVGQPPALPWTAGLPAAFRARHGYDLPPRLPALFYDTADAAAVRHDYWETVTDLFYNAWSRQLFDWCEAHGLELTGHHMAEDTLLAQMLWTGGVMPHYRAYHMPGIDKLGRHTWQVTTVKQLDSVAAQAGKRRALCEAFGCSGQDFAIEGRWWITTWLAVLGVNFFNPHLALYTLRGERKRDYPPTFSYQQPWWPYQRPYEDATARLCYALSQGTRQIDILVLHPLTSAWTAYRPGGHGPVEALDRMLARLVDGLLALHRDFHFGDETVLADLGRVEGTALRVGEQRYRVVVVPPLTTLRQATVDLLAQFAAVGGQVVAIGDGPAAIDGRPVEYPVLPPRTVWVADEVSDAAALTTPQIISYNTAAGDVSAPAAPIPDLPALRAALDAVCPPNVRIAGSGADRVWYHLRALPDGREVLFLANTRETDDVTCTVAWAGTGRVDRWDLLTGEATPTPSGDAAGPGRFTIALPRMGGALFVRTPGAAPAPARPAPVTRREIPLQPTWEARALTPNALVLDSCAYRIGTDDWRPPAPVLEAAEAIGVAGHGMTFGLRFAFTCDGPAPADAALVVEEPRGLTITVNGAPLPASDGWWLDRVCHRYPVAALLRPGENVVEVAGTLTAEMELEAIYLTGDFTVPAERVAELVTRKGSAFAGWRVAPRLRADGAASPYRSGDDLTGLGFPHFAGELRLTQTVALDGLRADERVYLAFEAVRAATALVEVNGQPAGQTLWPPYEIDVTAAVRPGENQVVVRLVSSLRNLLGPLHPRGGDPTSVAPATFRDRARWTDHCWLVPLGLGAARLEVRSHEEARAE